MFLALLIQTYLQAAFSLLHKMSKLSLGQVIKNKLSLLNVKHCDVDTTLCQNQTQISGPPASKRVLLNTAVNMSDGGKSKKRLPMINRNTSSGSSLEATSKEDRALARFLKLKFPN